MSKPIKYVVAVVLTDPNRLDQYLTVKRPDNDPDLGGAIGLPAATMRAGELPEQTAARVCREKLACDATPTRFIGIMFQKRNSYDIFLMDIEMNLNEGSEPDVLKAETEHTAYTEQNWSANPLDVMPSAKHGSCCSSIFLTDKGLLDREEWISSLEGSNIVS